MASKKDLKYVPLEAKNSTDHLDLMRAFLAPDMPHLKPSTASMHLRVPLSLLNNLKREANKRDVPYQSLVKILLDEKLKELSRK